MKRMFLFFVMTFAFIRVIVPAFAEDASGPAAVWEKSSWNDGFARSNKNILLNQMPVDAPDLMTIKNPNNGNLITEGSRAYETLTDGIAMIRDKSYTTCLPSNISLAYSLENDVDIYEVRIYSTWGDGGRDTLTINSVSAVKANGDSITLSPGAVTHSGEGSCAAVVLKMNDGSSLCTDVKEIIFNFGGHENGYVGYAELEVITDEEIQYSKIVEIGENEEKVISETPQDLTEAYGMMGGGLTITGSDTVVVQNTPMKNISSDGVYFINFWPWIKGTVTVQDGASLESNTSLFWGSGQGGNYKANERKLIIQSGAMAEFSPPNREVHIVGVENGTVGGAYVMVSGNNSRLLVNGNVYLGNKSDYAAHAGGMEICDGGYVEMDTFYLGHHTGALKLNVDGGTLMASGGIYAFKDGKRWTAADINFKDCVIETPVYKMGYPHGNGKSAVTFNGATFKPAGTPLAKFIDASPAGDPLCPHILTGKGLVVESPAGSSLEVSAMLQGDGGFEKSGAGLLVLSATNTYTGVTVVSAGTLRLAGRVAGAIEVKKDAVLALPLPDQDDVPCVPSFAMESGASLVAIDPQLPEGVRQVKVLESESPIAFPGASRDAQGNTFFVNSRPSGGSVLYYGKVPGLVVIVR